MAAQNQTSHTKTKFELLYRYIKDEAVKRRVLGCFCSIAIETLKNPLVVFLSAASFRWVRSSVRLEHRTFNPGVAGSIPVGPAN